MRRIIRYDREKPQLGENFYPDPNHWAKPSLDLLFNECAGTRIVDYSGNGFHGVASGEPAWNPAGMVFDGSVNRGVALPLSIKSYDHSLEFWIKPVDFLANYWFFDCSAGRKAFFITTTGYVNLYDTGQKYFIGQSVLTAGVWAHVIITEKADGTFALYQNGVFYAGNSTSVNANIGGTVRIGSNYSATAVYKGNMRIARAYPYVLSPDQAKSLYESPYQRFVREKMPYYSIPSGINMAVAAAYYRQLRSL